MLNRLSQTEAVKVWKHFLAISSIPHCSGHEDRLKDYIIGIARDNGFPWDTDEAGNLLVRLPGTTGANPRGTVLQCHLDMVCEKNADSPVDLLADPLVVEMREDDWLGARGTSLGADNGLGVAVCLALMECRELQTGPLELLFTVQEEIGLVGAKGLDPQMVKFRRLINLDSEDIQTFYVGCAGSLNTDIVFTFPVEDAPAGWIKASVEVSGLRGGHSGLDINLGRANAIRVVAGFLAAAAQKVDIKPSEFKGGSSLNAIPRSCRAEFFLPARGETDIQKLAKKTASDLQKEYAETEPGLTLKLVTGIKDTGGNALGSRDRDNLVSFLNTMPNGVISMEPGIPGLVRTSSNLALVDLREGQARIGAKQRSSSQEELAGAGQDIVALGIKAGAEAKSGDGYPPWPVNLNSGLLVLAQKAYTRALGQAVKVESMHAGLECSIIGGKYPDMDMISIGANILSPHSPDERVQISSVDKLWKFLKVLLTDLAGPAS